MNVNENGWEGAWAGMVGVKYEMKFKCLWAGKRIDRIFGVIEPEASMA